MTIPIHTLYGPGIDFPIMMIDVAGGNAKYYYYHNEIGSVIALLHNNGTVAEVYSYDAFGKLFTAKFAETAENFF